jgi:N-acetylneuraminic acid mutarotase
MLVLVFLAASCLMVAEPAFSSADVADDSWVSKASMHQARRGMGVAVVNGKIYVIGGYTKNGVVGTNEEYDPATDTWTLKKPMPTPRWRFAIAVYDNKIYCIGGETAYSSQYSGVNEVYDPATDTWVTKLPNMPTAKSGSQANVVNGRIYLLGGLPQLNLNEVYDPANNLWTTKAPLPMSAVVVSAVINNKIYAVGTYFNGSYISTTQIYDPDTNAWSTAAPPPSSVTGGSVAAVTSGEIAPKRMYVFGGTPYVNEPAYFVRVYDPENDSWTFGSDPPINRNEVAVGVVNDRMYVVGGYTITYFGLFSPSVTTICATNEQYTPLGYGTVPPKVAVASPENNVTYVSSNVSLVFTFNRSVLWMGYSVDGQKPVTVTGNTTVEGLSSGLHNVTVYAKDEFNNVGASETVFFSVAEESFPVAPVAAASIAAVAVVAGAVLLIYFRKRGR